MSKVKVDANFISKKVVVQSIEYSWRLELAPQSFVFFCFYLDRHVCREVKLPTRLTISHLVSKTTQFHKRHVDKNVWNFLAQTFVISTKNVWTLSHRRHLEKNVCLLPHKRHLDKNVWNFRAQTFVISTKNVSTLSHRRHNDKNVRTLSHTYHFSVRLT